MLKVLADTELDPRPEPHKPKILQRKAAEDAAAATTKALADAEATAKDATEAPSTQASAP